MFIIKIIVTTTIIIIVDIMVMIISIEVVIRDKEEGSEMTDKFHPTSRALPLPTVSSYHDDNSHCQDDDQDYHQDISDHHLDYDYQESSQSGSAVAKCVLLS